MADPEDESPTEPETRSSVTRGIASLFLWNQVLVISSLFLAMLGVNSLMAEVTITKIAISVFLLLLAIGGAIMVLGRKQGPPAMPPLPGGEIMPEPVAPKKAAKAAKAATTEDGQKGEMLPTGKPCPHCSDGELMFIPAYDAEFCKSCEKYA